jgi:ribulose-phosphate 3-epimerase
VHFEACPHLHRTIHAIKALGCRAGVALNPHTPVALLEDIIADIDMVILMSVNPGFGGQKFIPNTYKKIKELRKLAEYHNPGFSLKLMAGLTKAMQRSWLQAGANVLVAGNSVFSSAKTSSRPISDLKHVQIAQQA